MATKEYGLSSKDKQNDIVCDTFNDQFNNLNLNQNHKCLSVDTVCSKSTDNRKNSNYAISDVSDITECNDSKARKSVWNKSDDKTLALHDLSIIDVNEKPKKDKDSNVNNSTLSLHIAAYENSVESSNEFNEEEIKSEKQILIKKWKNPFEFPRQQEDEDAQIPEVAQFKASKRLLNPNQSSAAASQAGPSPKPSSMSEATPSKTDNQPPFGAEYAKTGRAKCKACREPISQGSLRMCTRTKSHFFDGLQDNWFHYECFWKRSKPDLLSEGNIRGMESLKWDDQEKIRQRIIEIK
uniref:PARP-type domain-containing protein n=1 Tax=Panagrolaimus sp. ES5 TaxID=591445 RepID=A0AC34G292_9BILA